MELSIFVYNVFFLWEQSNPTKRAKAIAEWLADKDYDVLVFSEAFMDPARELLLERLAESGYAYATPVLCPVPTEPLTRKSLLRRLWSLRKGYAMNGGMVMVSRWPITEHAEQLFTVRLGAERICPKGMLRCSINKKGSPFHFVGVHYQADDSMIRWWKLLSPQGQKAIMTGGAARMLQVEETRRYVESMEIPPTEPVFIVGDTNVHRDGPEYAPMLERLHATFPDGDQPFTIVMDENDFTRTPRRPGFLRWIEGDPFSATFVDEFVDYIMYSNEHLRPSEAQVDTVKPRTPADAESGEEYDLSDHYGVQGRFRW